MIELVAWAFGLCCLAASVIVGLNIPAVLGLDLRKKASPSTVILLAFIIAWIGFTLLDFANTGHWWFMNLNTR